MSPTPSSAFTRVGLAATLLLPAAFLGACSFIGGDSCDGTAAELKRLAAQPLLDAAPAHAAEPTNYRGVGVSTACDDDSPGEPWLHADRVYAYPGKAADVIAYYTRTAAAAGWRSEPNPPDAAPATVIGACWTKTEQGRHLLLNVDFNTDVYSPPPKVGNGIAYEVSVGSTADGGGGEEASCWQ
ncbi:hypothetical protein ACFOZ0_26095 [Streptomyces yaanensis]|uniref:Lipoprotein n=1 Tax=Streptomyces yaanensis TaxID=1142239 RepID=A0ABV7SIB2_9ACTN|nr:hypothetical protein [Streptomyces sp. CGMCC 4.7035]WNC01655.1 hypothetical protein Q2K21_28305 [Streptomyces sp. CGMCC 4.7035]